MSLPSWRGAVLVTALSIPLLGALVLGYRGSFGRLERCGAAMAAVCLSLPHPAAVLLVLVVFGTAGLLLVRQLRGWR